MSNVDKSYRNYLVAAGYNPYDKNYENIIFKNLNNLMLYRKEIAIKLLNNELLSPTTHQMLVDHYHMVEMDIKK